METIKEPGIEMAQKIPEALKIHNAEHCLNKLKYSLFKFTIRLQMTNPTTLLHQINFDEIISSHAVDGLADKNSCASCEVVVGCDWLQCLATTIDIS